MEDAAPFCLIVSDGVCISIGLAIEKGNDMDAGMTVDKWSLWDSGSAGTLLLTEDRIGVLVQAVDVETHGCGLVATGRSPSARTTVLAGEGEHTEEFERALVAHLEVFGIERAAVRRLSSGHTPESRVARSFR